MSQVLWRLVTAPTALFGDPQFSALSERRCELSFNYEGDSVENMTSVSLLFEGVEAFRCTHLSSCSAEMFRQPYGQLIDLEKTGWLKEVVPLYTKHRNAYGKPVKDLRHLMICFDDGPCYEFICTSFQESSAIEPIPCS